MTLAQVKTVVRMAKQSLLRHLQSGRPLSKAHALQCWDIVSWGDEAGIRAAAAEARGAIELALRTHEAGAAAPPGLPDADSCRALLAAQKILEHVVLGQPGPRAAPEAPKVIAGRGAGAGPRARVTARR